MRDIWSAQGTAAQHAEAMRDYSRAVQRTNKGETRDVGGAASPKGTASLRSDYHHQEVTYVHKGE
jgi:hypothetical protein